MEKAAGLNDVPAKIMKDLTARIVGQATVHVDPSGELVNKKGRLSSQKESLRTKIDHNDLVFPNDVKL